MNRLATKVRLAKWGIHHDLKCVLCGLDDESADHLSFHCYFTGEIWKKLLNLQGIIRGNEDWTTEIDWVVRYCGGHSKGASVYRMTLAAIIYQLWNERNVILLQQKKEDFKDYYQTDWAGDGVQT